MQPIYSLAEKVAKIVRKYYIVWEGNRPVKKIKVEDPGLENKLSIIDLVLASRTLEELVENIKKAGIHHPFIVCVDHLGDGAIVTNFDVVNGEIVYRPRVFTSIREFEDFLRNAVSALPELRLWILPEDNEVLSLYSLEKYFEMAEDVAVFKLKDTVLCEPDITKISFRYGIPEIILALTLLLNAKRSGELFKGIEVYDVDKTKQEIIKEARSVRSNIRPLIKAIRPDIDAFLDLSKKLWSNIDFIRSIFVAGVYNPITKTIALNLQDGRRLETMFHELAHRIDDYYREIFKRPMSEEIFSDSELRREALRLLRDIGFTEPLPLYYFTTPEELFATVFPLYIMFPNEFFYLAPKLYTAISQRLWKLLREHPYTPLDLQERYGFKNVEQAYSILTTAEEKGVPYAFVWILKKSPSELSSEERELLRRIYAELYGLEQLCRDIEVKEDVPPYVYVWIEHPLLYDIPGIDDPSRESLEGLAKLEAKRIRAEHPDKIIKLKQVLQNEAPELAPYLDILATKPITQLSQKEKEIIEKIKRIAEKHNITLKRETPPISTLSYILTTTPRTPETYSEKQRMKIELI